MLLDALVRIRVWPSPRLTTIRHRGPNFVFFFYYAISNPNSAVIFTMPLLSDRPGALATRQATRPAHLEWAAESGVEFAGPFLTEEGAVSGSLLVMSGGEDAVTSALGKDPYKEAGVFEGFPEVRAWVCGMRSSEVAAGGEKLFCIWCVDEDGKCDIFDYCLYFVSFVMHSNVPSLLNELHVPVQCVLSCGL